jgi:hypothetical protein
VFAGVLDRLKVLAVVCGHGWRNERWTARSRAFVLIVLPKTGRLIELI